MGIVVAIKNPILSLLLKSPLHISQTYKKNEFPRYNSTRLIVMEHDERQETTTPFIPVISRLDRLDCVLRLLEEKHSLSKVDKCGGESNNACNSLSSALEEVQHKGTLLERLTILEKRVLELSLEIDEGNRKDEFGIKDATKEIHQERASSTDGFLREKRVQHKSKGHEKKSQKKWLWLLRLNC